MTGLIANLAFISGALFFFLVIFYEFYDFVEIVFGIEPEVGPDVGI